MTSSATMVHQQQETASKVYRDYAGVPEAKANGTDEAATNSNKKNNNTNFPEKLHYVLKEMEKDGMEHVASWLPHGRCFVVHDPKAFENDILPFWFRQSKVASFQRQLNIYGFTRISEGVDKGGYYHEFFLRGKQFLARNISRIKIKGKGPRKSVDSQDLPNLYDFPFVPASQPNHHRSQTVIHPNHLQVPTTSAQRLMCGASTVENPAIFVSVPAQQKLPTPRLSASIEMLLRREQLLGMVRGVAQGPTQDILGHSLWDLARQILQKGTSNKFC